MPYTAADLSAALLAPQRTWAFRYDRVNSTGTVLGTENVLAASVANNYLADLIQRTCKVTLDSASTFNILTDQLRPYARLLMPDGGYQEWPLGTFLLSTSTKRRAALAGDRAMSLEGYDNLQVLLEDKVTARYVVAAGVAYTTAVATVLASANLPSSAVATAASTLPAAMEWPPGTSKLAIVNDLLSAIDYSPIYCDPLGVPTCTPYIEPGLATPLWRYGVSSASVTRPGLEVTLDLFGVPNVFIGSVSEPDRPALVSVVTNNDPADPLSTVGRGRSIVRIVESEGGAPATQAVLDAKVARVAAEAKQVYEEVAFTTGLMPFHGNGDVLEVDFGTGAVRYRETTWELDLRAGGEMKHNARRLVTL